jgi:TRAP-type mannitol/chloroaromatic compound transport system substrate-binding protein
MRHSSNAAGIGSVERSGMRKPGNGIDRRRALGIAGAGVVGALAAPHVARGQGAHNWSMAMSWPAGSPGVGVNAERCARMIEAMSGGRIQVTVYGAGELVPPFEVFDAVAEGTAQLGHGSPYFWQGKDSVFQFFSGVPFGLTAQEHSGWLYFGGAQELWDRAYEPFGVRGFYAGSSGPQAGGWFSRPIESLDDLRGLNMRIAGLGGEVMRRLGVNVVLLPPGEIFSALQAGTIDAAEWIGPWNDLAFGLYRTAKYYYMPAFHEFGPALELMVNAQAYEALDDDLKEIVKRAAMASATESFADFTYHNADSFRPLLDEEGVELRTWPDDIVRALAQQSEIVLAELAQASELGRETYDSFVAYRAKADEFARASDQRMFEMRAIGLDL